MEFNVSQKPEPKQNKNPMLTMQCAFSVPKPRLITIHLYGD